MLLQMGPEAIGKATDVILEYRLLGAIAVLLLAGLSAMFYWNQKQNTQMLDQARKAYDNMASEKEQTVQYERNEKLRFADQYVKTAERLLVNDNRLADLLEKQGKELSDMAKGSLVYEQRMLVLIEEVKKLNERVAKLEHKLDKLEARLS